MVFSIVMYQANSKFGITHIMYMTVHPMQGMARYPYVERTEAHIHHYELATCKTCLILKLLSLLTFLVRLTIHLIQFFKIIIYFVMIHFVTKEKLNIILYI
jgi:hypothetical protein